MKDESVFFKEIALLITHYNRSLSLERLLKSFEEKHFCFNEVIVSDDGSKSEHLNRLNQLKDKFGFKLICTDKNRGLGNNINKGQLAVQSPYTLYVQEDFIPTDQFYNCFINGLALIKEYPEVDLVRFYAYRQHPYLKPVKNGFSEMEFHFWRPNYWQFYCYSDHPHLRKSTFLDKFGMYAEGLHVERTEFKMCIKFLQKRGKALIHDDYRELFIQKNSAQEPGEYRKSFRKYRQSSNFFLVKIIRTVYRHIKFRLEYLFFN
ncbi:MAG: glycosyltransferase [Mangrovibacterium sp.]